MVTRTRLGVTLYLHSLSSGRCFVHYMMVASLCPSPSVSSWLWLRLFSFFKGALRQNSNKLLVIDFQQLEDSFRIVHTNLRAWLNILVLGLAGFRTERSKYGILRYCRRKPYNERAVAVQHVLALQTRTFVHTEDIRTGSFRHNRNVSGKLANATLPLERRAAGLK